MRDAVADAFAGRHKSRRNVRGGERAGSGHYKPPTQPRNAGRRLAKFASCGTSDLASRSREFGSFLRAAGRPCENSSRPAGCSSDRARLRSCYERASRTWYVGVRAGMRFNPVETSRGSVLQDELFGGDLKQIGLDRLELSRHRFHQGQIADLIDAAGNAQRALVKVMQRRA